MINCSALVSVSYGCCCLRCLATVQGAPGGDCGRAGEPGRLAGEAGRFRLGRRRSAVVCSGALLFGGGVLCPSDPVWSRSAHLSRVDVQLNSTMRLISDTVVPSVLHLSHGFQCSPTLNRQPYTKEGCHWQAGGENRQTWQLANPAWYT